MTDNKHDPNSKFTFDKEFHDIVLNKDVLKRATEKFLYNLIDDISLGIIFDLHRKYKTNAFDLDCDNAPAADADATSIDIFGQYNMKKNQQECVCPICDKTVAALRFAPHLQTCMGIGRSSSRNASRRVANNSKERDSSSYGAGMVSDDEDDADWNSCDKRKKKKDRNGNKKGKGTPKKTNEPEPTESVNVDVEGDEDDVGSLRDLLQDHSNGSSPVDSVTSTASSSGSTKKREKLKSKKSSKRDRSSPSANLSLE